MSFENPVAELGLSSGNAMPLSQIDVRALELDPVVFEPLPTIHDLSPLSITHSNSNAVGPAGRGGGGDGRAFHEEPLAVKNTPFLVPFATEESELFAHDWFGKLI